MREIKFRAWFPSEQRMTPEKTVFELCANANYFSQDLQPELILLQFTGLKDKNGVDIYEGDIYHQGDPNITYTVVWHDSGLIGKQNGSSSYAGLTYWLDRIEVIGNIYLTP